MINSSHKVLNIDTQCSINDILLWSVTSEYLAVCISSLEVVPFEVRVQILYLDSRTSSANVCESSFLASGACLNGTTSNARNPQTNAQ